MGDKLAHGLEYGILGILLFRAFQKTTHGMRSISLAIICAVAFGLSDEIHQWFVPHRQADIWDLLADTIGATGFILAWVFVTKAYDLRHARNEVDML
ncbi:MAG: VanZ family protein [Nitrospirota bacterium]|nr:VanZ family protein [Nitrospirota bacterium]